MRDAEDHGQFPVNLDWVPERAPSASKWRIPRFLKQVFPSFIMDALHDLKRRALARDFPGDREFEQSPDEAHASASMSIVVPIHDAPLFTRRCLTSLEKYAPESEVILVDDASALSETLDVIQEFSSRNGWKVLHNEKPTGHSAACGAGATFATRPYLCLLNSDIVATPWCWKLLKEPFERDKEIGVTAPSTSHGGTPQTLSLACEIRFHLNDNQICAFANRVLTETSEPLVVDMPWVSGFAFFIRRELWQDLGGFDPNLPDYGNEIELCKRIKDKGHRIVWVRNSYIHHFGQQSYQNRVGFEGIHARIRAARAYIESKTSSKTTVV